MSCIEDVFMSGEAASCYEITCTVSVCQGVVREEKYLVLSF